MPRALVLAVVLAGGLGACHREEAPPDAAEAPPAVPSPSLVVSSGLAQRVGFGRDVNRLIMAGQFDSLEALARELRTTWARWPNGGWKLRTFYYEGFDKSMDEREELQWSRLFRQLHGWIAATPGSETARIALVNSLVGYAWVARGSGFASTVTDSGSRLFHQRLAEAHQVLLQARQLPDSCPGWWAAAERVALGEGWDRRVYDSVFTAAIRYQPTFDAYYDLRAHHLSPWWYGEANEWETDLRTVTDRLLTPLGPQEYARVVWYLHDRFEDGDKNIFNATSASWERTRAGFESLRHNYPESIELLSEYAYLADEAGDRERTRALFGELGDRVDLGVWRSRETFLAARQKALSP